MYPSHLGPTLAWKTRPSISLLCPFGIIFSSKFWVIVLLVLAWLRWISNESSGKSKNFWLERIDWVLGYCICLQMNIGETVHTWFYLMDGLDFMLQSYNIRPTKHQLDNRYCELVNQVDFHVKCFIITMDYQDACWYVNNQHDWLEEL